MESAMLTIPNSAELCVPTEESPSVLGVSASSEDHECFPTSQTPDTSLQNLCEDQISHSDAHTTGRPESLLALSDFLVLFNYLFTP